MKNNFHVLHLNGSKFTAEACYFIKGSTNFLRVKDLNSTYKNKTLFN